MQKTYMRWIQVIFISISTLLLAAVLTTYNFQDVSWTTHTTAPAPITNICGTVGAHLAGLLIYLFGLSAWCLVVLGIFATTHYTTEKSAHTKNRFYGLFLLSFTIPLLMQLTGFAWYTHEYPGGIFGHFGIQAFSTLFDTMIIECALYSLLVIGLFLTFGTTWASPLASIFLRTRIITKPRYAQAVHAPETTQDPLQDLVNATAPETHSLHAEYKKPILPINNIPLPTQNSRAIAQLERKARLLQQKLEHFGVYGTITKIIEGPVVTLFEYQPDIECKISKILAREDDLALALQAISLRIIAPIPGKSVVGFEVANEKRKSVLFSETAAQGLAIFKGALPLIIGQNSIGKTIIIDLATLPHILVAGSTGSGKSVALHAFISGLLCHTTPSQMSLILIDPKRLEFANYADIPHLIFPIITDSLRAVAVLTWAVKTMEERYEMMARAGARTLQAYREQGNTLPYITIVIDEFADLMMTSGKEIEHLVVRLAQMARAAGIHLILATQRPSVDVITGLIKVNFPARIACKVISKIDSRTIIDSPGADKLLGKGDMLFLDPQGVIHRLHGAYITDTEIKEITDHIKSQASPQYLSLHTVLQNNTEDTFDAHDTKLFQDICIYVREVDGISISSIQRRFKIGYNRSARMVDMLEKQGIISSADTGKIRKTLRS